ncbi:MAG: short-chain dehydrogenase [Candidatus Delongbacteria bacterium]|nr:MAG: short-chain dehydrogenase [Candidatus Delongbacteria bacterium]
MRTALITGASGGIGKEFAQLFAENGYNLVLVARSEEKLKHIAQKLESQYKIKVTVLVEDLAKPNTASKLYEEVKKRGIIIDTLINNAGFGDLQDFVEENLNTVTEMLQLNVTTLTGLTSLFVKDMKARNSGKILNVASTAAFQPLPKFAVYAATKAYVLHFTEALHYELRNTAIKVSVLCPGPTSTGFNKRANAEELNFLKNGMDSKTVAQIGYNGLMKNKMTVIAGFKNKLMSLSRTIPSRRLLIQVIGKMF